MLAFRAMIVDIVSEDFRDFEQRHANAIAA